MLEWYKGEKLAFEIHTCVGLKEGWTREAFKKL